MNLDPIRNEIKDDAFLKILKDLNLQIPNIDTTIDDLTSKKIDDLIENVNDMTLPENTVPPLPE